MNNLGLIHMTLNEKGRASQNFQQVLLLSRDFIDSKKENEVFVYGFVQNVMGFLFSANAPVAPAA